MLYEHQIDVLMSYTFEINKKAKMNYYSLKVKPSGNSFIAHIWGGSRF